MVWAKPLPSVPIRRSAGTNTSSITKSAVSDRRMPILSSCLPTLTPASLFSTSSRLMP